MATVPSDARPTWRGHLEQATRDAIRGWAQDDEDPARALRLRILDDGVCLGECVADQFREDLFAAGIGDGHRAFSFPIPGGLDPGRRHLIEVHRADDGRPLHGSPCIVEAAPPATGAREAQPARWKSYLDSVSRALITGWAFDERTPEDPVALSILDNGRVIGRVLANRHRGDLENAGLGGGRHAFSFLVPGGLSPLTPHLIQVLGEADGAEVAGSPVTLAAATDFDPSLEHAIRTAVSAIATPGDCARVLEFFAGQMELLLQRHADLRGQRERRLLERLRRRSGVPDPSRPSTPLPLRALVIDDRVPAIGRDAGSAAILSHMKALQTLGYEVSLIASEEWDPAPTSRDALKRLGIDLLATPYYASVEEAVRRHPDGFDLFYFHRVWNATKYLTVANRHNRRARLVYGVADLHHLRMERQGAVMERPELLARSQQVKAAECAAAASADVVITHSTTEAAWLREAVPGCPVHVIPWFVPVRPTLRPVADRHGVLFVGSFSHAPNVDAARYLVEDVMPRVWAADPTIHCTLAGSRAAETVQRLRSERVSVESDVPELAVLYDRARLTVAPLRFGAGVKGKVLDSFAAGVPCVLSPIAAEGMELPPELATGIGKDAADLAAQILRLHADPVACQRLAEAGTDFLRARYGEAAVVCGFEAALGRSTERTASNRE